MGQKVACANGKGINKTLKVRPKSIPKSMTNRYKFHARKRDTPNIKIHQTNEQKMRWKVIKKIKKTCENKKEEQKR